MDGTFSCVIAPCRVLNIGYPVATRPVLPVQASSPAGVHPVVSAAVTAGARLARWQAVSGHAGPRTAKSSPAGQIRTPRYRRPGHDVPLPIARTS